MSVNFGALIFHPYFPLSRERNRRIACRAATLERLPEVPPIVVLSPNGTSGTQPWGFSPGRRNADWRCLRQPLQLPSPNVGRGAGGEGRTKVAAARGPFGMTENWTPPNRCNKTRYCASFLSSKSLVIASKGERASTSSFLRASTTGSGWPKSVSWNEGVESSVGARIAARRAA
jgi:hypothetical protein